MQISLMEYKEHNLGTKRWVVERVNLWHNRFRKLMIRYEKEENYNGLVMFANCLIVYRAIPLLFLSVLYRKINYILPNIIN